MQNCFRRSESLCLRWTCRRRSWQRFAEIEAEQALVAANGELIVRFEKNVQATLARVSGEDDSAIGSGHAGDNPSGVLCHARL